jgi:protein ImuB
MKSRTASRTADLFAAQPLPAACARPSEAISREAMPAPPPAQPASRPRSNQLWYAVVFPELDATRPQLSLQRLCLHAQQFTSLVSIEMPNALLLEIKGSVKLFGSLARLHAGIDAAWRRLGLKAQSAAAPSTLAALWLARAGKQVLLEDPALLAGQLAALPLACTSWDAERLRTLSSMGVRSVGELLRLPRAGVARRFAPGTVLDLDIALARQAAPRRGFVPRERFRARRDLEMEVENAAYLEIAVAPLIEQCARFLRERQAGIQNLELRLRHRVGAATRVRLGLASSTGELRRLTDVVMQKLSRLDLAAPVREVALLSGSLQPLVATPLDAFNRVGGAGGRDTAPQLVERLRARLGEETVYGVCSIAEHRPEAAWRRVHALRLSAALRGNEKTDRPAAEHAMPRPVWLLAEPVQLCGPLLFEQGPERIESGWWDGKGIARDYYIAHQAQDPHQTRGARLWVFQERQSKCWYVHGVFA